MEKLQVQIRHVMLQKQVKKNCNIYGQVVITERQV